MDYQKKLQCNVEFIKHYMASVNFMNENTYSVISSSNQMAVLSSLEMQKSACFSLC